MKFNGRILMHSFIFIVFLAAMCSVNGTAQQFVPLLRKNADTSQSQTGSAKKIITIRLAGIQPDDFINIRPRDEAKIAVAGGTLLKGDFTLDFKVAGIPVKPGVPLPDSALNVSTTAVRFDRPPDSNQTVFLDIQIPSGALAEVLVDGERLLKSALKQPLSLQNKNWGYGALNTLETMVRAAGIYKDSTISGDQVAYDRSTGRYAVPSSKLEVLSKTSIRSVSGLSMVVVMEIDETGRVTKVTPLTNSADPNLERQLMKWRFAPYKVNDQPVPITTMLNVSAH